MLPISAAYGEAQLKAMQLQMPGTTELSSPLTPRIARFRAFAEPSTSPHSLSGICRGCQTRERRGQRGTGRETWKEKDFQYVTDGQQA